MPRIANVRRESVEPGEHVFVRFMCKCGKPLDLLKRKRWENWTRGSRDSLNSYDRALKNSAHFLAVYL
jgi:hypothetical protein